uniref:trichohyalin-like n=1 Tax=Scatophagus argus TaxID=75038 RepID=UPI001ED8068C|nr:trichohyalin-like [Scatophagus argus]
MEEKERSFQKEMEEKETTFQKEMEEKERSFQKELSQAKQSFKKELSDSQLQSSKELFLLSETWERRAQQWKQEKRDLEKTLLVKENILKHKEAEGVKASHDEWKKSTERKSLEEKWQRKVSQLEELLLQKDKLVRQADNKRRAHAEAHTDTLAQLVVTQSALKQSRQTCEALEQKIQSQMAKNNVSHQKKLLGQEKGFKKKLEAKERHFQRELEEKEKTFQKEMEEKEKTFQKELSQANQSFKKELSDSQLQSTKELFLLSETWEIRAQQWKQEKRDLEETLLVKENILKHKEAEGVKASLDEWKKSTKLKSVEEKWQRKVSQLEEVLQEKDKLVSRADDKRALAKAHTDTLAQLGVTQSALKQSRQTCEALEQKIQSQLAESNVSHQKKLLEQEKGFKKVLEEKERSFQKQFSQAKQSFEKELSDSQLQSTKELFLLSETWERRAQQWKQEKRDLEETLLVKEKIWNNEEAERKKELQHLTKIPFQLQQLTKAKAEPKQKKNLWSCRLQKWNSSKGSFSATCPFQDDSPPSTHPTLYPNP